MQTAFKCHSTKRAAPAHTRSRRAFRVYATSKDPENLFKAIPVAEGIIERRMMQKLTQTDQKFAAMVAMSQDEDRKKVLFRRESRTPPTDHIELIEFFLNTQADDMEFEVARCRPQLTSEFFKQLDTLVGNERFAAKPDEERLAELDMLRQYLDEAKQAVDIAVASNISAVERMKKLLTAPDKKEMIRLMAEANEIDVALLDLLQQNIQAAREAGQEEPAKFMEKVRQAAMKFSVTVEKGGKLELPNAPVAKGGKLQLPNAAAETGGKLELPGAAADTGRKLELPNASVENGGKLILP